MKKKHDANAAVEKARDKVNTASETTYCKLPTDHAMFAEVPTNVADHWKEVKLASNANVIIVKDVDFAVCPQRSHKTCDKLMIAMMFGKRIALPEYLQSGCNKDHLNTSMKFVGATHKVRGIVIGEEFAKKHRFTLQNIQKACVANGGKGWQVIAIDDEAAWAAAGKPVSHINAMQQFVDLLKADAHHDRNRSAKGKYQRK